MPVAHECELVERIFNEKVRENTQERTKMTN